MSACFLDETTLAITAVLALFASKVILPNLAKVARADMRNIGLGM
jgi:hypothetical protein